jgi:threonine/homoserine/homoserine lactone efflux protein
MLAYGFNFLWSYMPMDALFALVMFSFTMMITPGPNNIMVAASGANFGYRRTVPHILGISFGFPLMVFLIGMGLGKVFESYPLVHVFVRYAGSAYLLYLAYKIARFTTVVEGDAGATPISFFQAVLFQWVNPKAWIMAFASISTFTIAGEDYYGQVLLITVVYGLFAFPCQSLWTIMGVGVTRFLKEEKYQRIFNITMALLLVTSLISFHTSG